MDNLDVKNKIRKCGLKATPNRVAVYEYMLGSKEHPSAEMIREHLNSIGKKFSIATVYNILEAFLEKGLIIRIKDDDNNMMRFDANTSFHVHIYNVNTNEIIDYENMNHTKKLEKDLKIIKDEINLKSDEHKIVAEI